jgi:hypothetical protein
VAVRIFIGDNGAVASDETDDRLRTQKLARLILAAFLLTFLLSRILVLLIMSRRIPDFFLHVGQTHVHHLNYGIFLLSAIGAYLLFERPSGRRLSVCAIIYAIGLGLTFDEFGMWLHLGGGYWQRASYDAVVIIAALLGLIVVAPAIKRFHTKHWLLGVAVVMLMLWFLWLVNDAIIRFDKTVGPKLQRLENAGPG